ncbi:ROK family protein [Motilibacter deserti]|uniref:ROK family protein n=1 Tax=Motilibacter deserti TaxID=2714956 RepID=UPI0018C87BFD|nr:ROK family protein [Motilibacter deserti]
MSAPSLSARPGNPERTGDPEGAGQSERAAGVAVLAVDVGSSRIDAEILDERLACLARASTTTPSAGTTVTSPSSSASTGGDPTADAVVGLCRRLAGSAPPGVPVRRLGLAAAAAVDTRAVAAALAVPVVVTDEATAAGLAEWRHGAGRGSDDVLVVLLDAEIAAAVIADGALVRGRSGQAGRLGHLGVRREGPVCACGLRGCLDVLASTRAIVDAYNARSLTPVARATELRARLGADPVANEVWRGAAAALAEALLTACALLAPARVVLAGELAATGEAWLEPVRAGLAAASPCVSVPPVVAAELGPRAGVLGAAMAALEAA